MAFVRFDTTLSTLSQSMLKVRGSISANTGLPPSSATASAAATNENAGTITSSPGRSPTAIKANVIASVPLPQLIQYFAFT